MIQMSYPPLSDHALNSKFLIVFAFVQDKIENCGLARWRAVFEGLFDFAVEKHSPELLAELLDLSGGGSVAKFRLKPEPNHPALLKACGKGDYGLIRDWT